MYTACVLGDLNNTGYAYICGPTSIFFYPPQLSVSFNVQVGGRTLVSSFAPPPTPREGDLARYVPLASQSPYPIKVYSVANYRPHFSQF